MIACLPFLVYISMSGWLYNRWDILINSLVETTLGECSWVIWLMVIKEVYSILFKSILLHLEANLFPMDVLQ
jgi:hypothetical protein